MTPHGHPEEATHLAEQVHTQPVDSAQRLIESLPTPMAPWKPDLTRIGLDHPQAKVNVLSLLALGPRFLTGPGEPIDAIELLDARIPLVPIVDDRSGLGSGLANHLIQPSDEAGPLADLLVLPMSGQGGDWIVKLPDRRLPEVPANEYAMMTWARLAGIDVPEIRLVEGARLTGLPDGLIDAAETALAVRRFDRLPGGRVHQEDFAQVREVAVSSKYDRATYGGLARVISTVCPQDLEEYVRRLAAIVVMGNLDAHLKNWTLRYPDGVTARLSPAYDLVSVSSYDDFRTEELAFPVNGGKVAKAVTFGNFRSLARRAGLDGDRVAGVVRDTVIALAESWSQAKAEADVPAFVTSHIEGRLRTLPLVAETRQGS